MQVCLWFYHKWLQIVSFMCMFECDDKLVRLSITIIIIIIMNIFTLRCRDRGNCLLEGIVWCKVFNYALDSALSHHIKNYLCLLCVMQLTMAHRNRKNNNLHIHMCLSSSLKFMGVFVVFWWVLLSKENRDVWYPIANITVFLICDTAFRLFRIYFAVYISMNAWIKSFITIFPLWWNATVNLHLKFQHHLKWAILLHIKYELA